MSRNCRRASSADFSNFGLILAMDQNNLDSIEAQRPAGNQIPVCLFTCFAPEAALDHVPDRYYTRDFDGCLDLIELAAAGLKRALTEGEG
jgi:protein-tyrosine phosphatase